MMFDDDKTELFIEIVIHLELIIQPSIIYGLYSYTILCLQLVLSSDFLKELLCITVHNIYSVIV